jgi:hypothetical protein
MSRRYVILGAAAVVVVASAAAAGIVAVNATSGPPYPVNISPGVNPHLPRDRVAQIVIERVPDAAIERMDVLADDTHVQNLEPNAARPVEAAPIGPVWVVRARGHFVGRRTPPGTPPVVAKSGYFVIDDNSGDILEMGMP